MSGRGEALGSNSSLFPAKLVVAIDQQRFEQALRTQVMGK